jgi:hypothetical protein
MPVNTIAELFHVCVSNNGPLATKLPEVTFSNLLVTNP